jgi:hypothetical protein
MTLGSVGHSVFLGFRALNRVHDKATWDWDPWGRKLESGSYDFADAWTDYNQQDHPVGARLGMGLSSAQPPLPVKLEWVKQLSQDPKSFIIAVVRNPDKAELLQPLLGTGVVAVEGDIADIDSFQVRTEMAILKCSISRD